MHPYMRTLGSLFLLWVCDVLLLVVVMRTLLFFMVTAVYTARWSHGISSAPPRVEVVSCLVRQDDFVPSTRFPEDGLEASNCQREGAGAE